MPELTLDSHVRTITEAEIARQPRVWEKTADLIAEFRCALDDFLRKSAPAGTHVILTGAGTSAFIGEVIAPDLGAATGNRVSAVPTTTLLSNPYHHLTDDRILLVSFARSGASPESLAATKVADELIPNASHLIITCNPDGPLAQAHRSRADSFVLCIPEANDAAFAMTSSFTGMLLGALLVFNRTGAPAVRELAAVAERLIADSTQLRSRVGVTPSRVVWLGSGPLAGLAREAALKQMELTAGTIPSFFDSPLGFRHGPKAILDGRTLVVVFLSNNAYTRQYDEDIVEEIAVSTSQCRVMTVGPGVLRDGTPPTFEIGNLPPFTDESLAVIHILVAQLLAVELSVRMGMRTDNPFPSGDVNRVVQGVTIHELPAGEV